MASIRASIRPDLESRAAHFADWRETLEPTSQRRTHGLTHSPSHECQPTTRTQIRYKLNIINYFSRPLPARRKERETNKQTDRLNKQANERKSQISVTRLPSVERARDETAFPMRDYPSPWLAYLVACRSASCPSASGCCLLAKQPTRTKLNNYCKFVCVCSQFASLLLQPRSRRQERGQETRPNLAFNGPTSRSPPLQTWHDVTPLTTLFKSICRLGSEPPT